MCGYSAPVFTHRCGTGQSSVSAPNFGFYVFETSHSPAARDENLGSRKNECKAQQLNDETSISLQVW